MEPNSFNIGFCSGINQAEQIKQGFIHLLLESLNRKDAF